MYTREQKERFSRILVGVADSLDIPPSKYLLAVNRYRAVGNWLEQGRYADVKSPLEVYPQGSFRLGTVVRPVTEEDEYDIDLVSQVNLQCDSPHDLKHVIGNRLKEHERYRSMLKREGRRCWSIGYAEDGDGATFHIDILPAVPDDGTWMQDLVSTHGVSNMYAQHAIAATDKNKKTAVYTWCKSNPRGYAKWFDDVNFPVFSRIEPQERRRLFENNRALFARVEDVPPEIVKTPLQKAIQILKRHRDMYFNGDETKPLSMIITTLCALSYEGEVDLYSTLSNIAKKTVDFQTSGLIQRRDIGWWIPNPVDPAENFADKWNEDARLPKSFFQWLSKLQDGLRSIVEQPAEDRLAESLEPLFGPQPVKSALSMLAEPVKSRVTPHPRIIVNKPNEPWCANGMWR